MIKQGEEIIKIVNGIAEINPNLDKKIIILGPAEINKETGDIIKSFRQSCINCEVFIATGLNDDKKEENSLNNWLRLS